jgi:CheY-like chemotaxis protein
MQLVSGSGAIASLERLNPDMMPIMDGIEVCQKIKAISQWSAVPIIESNCLQAGLPAHVSFLFFHGSPVSR